MADSHAHIRLVTAQTAMSPEVRRHVQDEVDVPSCPSMGASGPFVKSAAELHGGNVILQL